MVVELATSTHSRFFANTVVAYRFNGGGISVFTSGESEQLTLVSFLKMLVQKCRRGEALTVRSPENSLTQPFEKRWIDQWEREDFTRKTLKHPGEWKALRAALAEKGINEPTFNRIEKDALAALKDAIHEQRTGRKKQVPHVPRPGEPNENPWSKDEESLEQYLARKTHKD